VPNEVTLNQPDCNTIPGTATNSNVLVDDAQTLRDGIWPRSTPFWMAAFYMALYIIRPWEQIFPSWQIFYPERSFMIFLIAVIALSKTKKVQSTWQTTTVFMFLAAVAISGACALRPSLAWDPLYSYFALVVFYYILLVVVSSPYDLCHIVLCYIAIICVYLAKSEWEYFVNGQHRYDMGVIRMVGIENTFGGPNALGMSIIISLPFGLFLWRNRTTFAHSWPVKWQARLRYGLLLYATLAVSSLILTNSRSTLLGFLVFCSLVMLRGKGFGQKLKYLTLGAVALSVVWALMPEENKGRFLTIWAPEEGPSSAQVSAEGRIEGYKAGMQMFRRFPVAGVGLGNFIDYRAANVDGVALEAHNLAGQIFGELGLIGVSSFFLLLTAIWMNCRSIIGFSKNRSDERVAFLADLARACRLSLVLILFLGLFGHNLYRAHWLWLAAFSDLARQMVRQRLDIEPGTTS
jgi:O-antigen ligase